MPNFLIFARLSPTKYALWQFHYLFEIIKNLVNRTSNDNISAIILTIFYHRNRGNIENIYQLNQNAFFAFFDMFLHGAELFTNSTAFFIIYDFF